MARHRDDQRHPRGRAVDEVAEGVLAVVAEGFAVVRHHHDQGLRDARGGRRRRGGPAERPRTRPRRRRAGPRTRWPWPRAGCAGPSRRRGAPTGTAADRRAPPPPRPGPGPRPRSRPRARRRRASCPGDRSRRRRRRTRGRGRGFGPATTCRRRPRCGTRRRGSARPGWASRRGQDVELVAGAVVRGQPTGQDRRRARAGTAGPRRRPARRGRPARASSSTAGVLPCS